MVMPRTTATTPLSAGGAESEQGRRPTLVSAPPAVSPELLDRPRRRRTFTASDKLRILAEVDRAGPGGGGAILWREGLYSSARSAAAGSGRVASVSRPRGARQYHRSAEKALTAVIQEAYVQGISTRSVYALVRSPAIVLDRTPCRIFGSG